MKPTRQEFNWGRFGILSFSFMILFVILTIVGWSQNTQLQSQINEMKQNGTYNVVLFNVYPSQNIAQTIVCNGSALIFLVDDKLQSYPTTNCTGNYKPLEYLK